MKKEIIKKEEKSLTSVVFSDSNFQYEPNRSYRGSARVDEDGNFAFHPYREATDDCRGLQWVSGGNIGRNYHWALHRSAHTMKITLTIRDFDQLNNCTRKVTEVMRNLFVKAMYELTSLL